jgi:hypothetical protein
MDEVVLFVEGPMSGVLLWKTLIEIILFFVMTQTFQQFFFSPHVNV